MLWRCSINSTLVECVELINKLPVKEKLTALVYIISSWKNGGVYKYSLFIIESNEASDSLLICLIDAIQYVKVSIWFCLLGSRGGTLTLCWYFWHLHFFFFIIREVIHGINNTTFVSLGIELCLCSDTRSFIKAYLEARFFILWRVWIYRTSFCCYITNDRFLGSRLLLFGLGAISDQGLDLLGYSLSLFCFWWYINTIIALAVFSWYTLWGRLLYDLGLGLDCMIY